MALFKISKGLKANLPEEKTAGYCWYTVDDSLFYIDYVDENNEIQRKALNAKDAEKLSGAALKDILNNSQVEIPTSSAVFAALSGKADKSTSLSGYGISDAYTKTEVDTELAKKFTVSVDENSHTLIFTI